MSHFFQTRKKKGGVGGPLRITAFTRDFSYWGKTNEKIEAASSSFELHLVLNDKVAFPQSLSDAPC